MGEAYVLYILFDSIPLAASFVPLELALILPCLSWMLLFGYYKEWKILTCTKAFGIIEKTYFDSWDFW